MPDIEAVADLVERTGDDEGEFDPFAVAEVECNPVAAKWLTDAVGDMTLSSFCEFDEFADADIDAVLDCCCVLEAELIVDGGIGPPATPLICGESDVNRFLTPFINDFIVAKIMWVPKQCCKSYDDAKLDLSNCQPEFDRSNQI